MMRRIRLFITLFVLISVFYGCQDQFEGNEKYQRPDWLVGKIFSQIESREDFSMFAQLMRDVGYDTIVNKSGAYAAFVPINEAVQDYMNSKMFGSLADIPFEVKEELVKFHLVQMPWNSDQLQGLSLRGWINENDVSNNKPTAFKRQTLLRADNKTYPVNIQVDGSMVVETIVPQGGNDTKTVFANSRKYVPLFFDSYLDLAGMSPGDYAFYFDRNYEFGNIFYADARILGEEIFSDNGFIYAIDKLVDPLRNVEEIMEEGSGDETFLLFKDLINQGSEFTFNTDATFSQSGANAGIDVDDLFDLSYPGVLFDIHQELTFDPNSTQAPGNTLERHFGIVVPTDQAFNEFVDEYLRVRVQDMPVNLKRLIINSHMSDVPVYEQGVSNGFYNAVGDLVKLDPSTIVNREFGSNATFIGVNKMIVPKAFSSVSGFLYLDPNYLTYLLGLQFANILEALKDEGTHFSLFVIPDRVIVEDASMEVIWNNPFRQDTYILKATIPGVGQHTYTRREVADIMFSQIGVEPLIGAANKEFIETLNGKHLLVDNVNKTISGGVPSVFGFNGDSTITVDYTPLEGNFYNGDVYEINGWLNFPGVDLLTRLYGSKYFELLRKAGLATEFDLKFAHPAERYTIFLPSESALNEIQADTLTGNNLVHFLLSHVIKDELIFTDGRKTPGLYRTMSRKGTGNNFHQLNIGISIDNITLFDDIGNTITDIPEHPTRANIITTRTLNDMISTSAVIHHIDTVISINP